MSYGARLQTAMNDASVDRKTLAAKLHMSVQAVGQVISGKTKSLDAVHHTKAALLLRCDPLWLAAGGRREHPVTVVTTGEAATTPAFGELPAGLTSIERDIVLSLRSLPERRVADLHSQLMTEAQQFLADLHEINARTGVKAPVSAKRAAEVLPVRPDGEQPNTEPGLLG